MLGHCSKMQTLAWTQCVRDVDIFLFSIKPMKFCTAWKASNHRYAFWEISVKQSEILALGNHSQSN